MHHPILAPAIVLVAWSLVMLVWMMIARGPAMKKAGIDVSTATGGHPGFLDGTIDAKAQWPAHNYMHLMEQPTLFYAVVFILALEHAGGGWNTILAWAYVGLRILHSLVQATFNRIIIRFSLFALSTLVLIALTLHAAMAVWNLHA
jgi:hypothetical protein